MKLRLERLFVADGIVGRLNKADGLLLCYTLELPYCENIHNISCIPLGTYNCLPFHNEKYGHTWEVCDVPDRSGILFHVGNYVHDTHGCILLGEDYFGKDTETLTLERSEKAKKAFMEVLKDEQIFTLEIVDGRPSVG